MYRIHFKSTTGMFVLQVIHLGLFWRDVKDVSFPSYELAQQHVQQIGLDKLYEDKSENRRREYQHAYR